MSLTNQIPTIPTTSQQIIKARQAADKMTMPELYSLLIVVEDEIQKRISGPKRLEKGGIWRSISIKQ